MPNVAVRSDLLHDAGVGGWQTARGSPELLDGGHRVVLHRGVGGLQTPLPAGSMAPCLALIGGGRNHDGLEGADFLFPGPERKGA
jgi:hypothetical protein